MSPEPPLVSNVCEVDEEAGDPGGLHVSSVMPLSVLCGAELNGELAQD